LSGPPQDRPRRDLNVDAKALRGGSAPSAASGASARDVWQLAAGGRADTWLLYVDRNPRAFAVVLDLIRCGKVPPLPLY
jgi:hypothetical protein